MDITDTLSKLFGIGVIGSQIFIVFGVVFYFLKRKNSAIYKFLSENGILFSFLAALAATFGSLFYSNVAGFPPCEMCWFQRIFLYPEVLIFGLALIKKDKNITDYGLSLAFAGWLISIYHNYIYYQGSSSIVCKIGESCIIPYVTEFGYVTIPMMAFTVFSLILTFLIFSRQKKN